jgi:hypothetical protein
LLRKKLANTVSKTNKDVVSLSKIPILGTLARVTGVITIYNNGSEAREEYKKGNYMKAAWKGFEAAGTGVIMFFGGEELELGWNLATMAVDGVSQFLKK